MLLQIYSFTPGWTGMWEHTVYLPSQHLECLLGVCTDIDWCHLFKQTALLLPVTSN